MGCDAKGRGKIRAWDYPNEIRFEMRSFENETESAMRSQNTKSSNSIELDMLHGLHTPDGTVQFLIGTEVIGKRPLGNLS